MKTRGMHWEDFVTLLEEYLLSVVPRQTEMYVLYRCLHWSGVEISRLPRHTVVGIRYCLCPVADSGVSITLHSTKN